ncbi:MAG: rod shape-determining protein MreC [Clostridium sp.]|nr:rod shape-determining protein MreC [Clostridium sp.]
MHNLLTFLVRTGTWMLFIIYVVISCVLLFSSNPYHHHLWLTTASTAASAVYSAASNVTSYFNLRSINDDLLRRNTDLELEVLGLRQQLRQIALTAGTDTLKIDSLPSRYGFTLAHVINNSISRPYNYITIEKGSLDGIEPEMGVVDVNGVVGIVNKVGPHSARIISVLNPHLRLSCKVKNSEHIGSLVWDGKDSRDAVLEELPRHAVYAVGDTIVTSGFSSAFPAGVAVGRVIADMPNRDDNFRALRVRLFTDFSTLRTVRIIRDYMKPELAEVESDDDIAEPKF